MNTNFYTVLKPLLIFSKIFGLYPNAIDYEYKNLKYNNIVEIVWSLFLMTTLTIYSICTMNIGSKTQIIIDIGDLINMSVSLTNTVVITINSIVRRRKLLSFIQKLINFDNKIQFLDPPYDISKEYVQTRYYVMTGIFAAIVLIIIFIIVDVVVFLEEVTFTSIGAEVITYVYPLIIMILMVLQYCTIVLLIKQKFKWINLKLIHAKKKWHNDLKNQSNRNSLKRTVSTHISEKTFTVIENLRRRHYELCNFSEELNQIYNFPILMTCLNLFISITFTIYFYFIGESDIKLKYPILYSVYYTTVGLINCGLLYGMIKASSLTKQEGKAAGEILHTINDKTNEVETGVLHFSFQILQHDIEFTACHVFVLDESSLFSIIGGITTYLIIIVQFQFQL